MWGGCMGMVCGVDVWGGGVGQMGGGVGWNCDKKPPILVNWGFVIRKQGLVPNRTTSKAPNFQVDSNNAQLLLQALGVGSRGGSPNAVPLQLPEPQ